MQDEKRIRLRVVSVMTEPERATKINPSIAARCARLRKGLKSSMSRWTRVFARVSA